MAHAQKPDFVFPRNGRVHLNRWGRQFSRLLAAELCASAWVMLDRPRSEVAWEYWLPTPFASFPFTSPPVRHRVPPGSERAIRDETANILVHIYSAKPVALKVLWWCCINSYKFLTRRQIAPVLHQGFLLLPSGCLRNTAASFWRGEIESEFVLLLLYVNNTDFIIELGFRLEVKRKRITDYTVQLYFATLAVLYTQDTIYVGEVI